MFRLENCDAIDFLKTIDDNSVNLILTDPPYIINPKGGGKYWKKGQSRENPETISYIKKLNDKYKNLCNGFDIEAYFKEFKRIQPFINGYFFCNVKLMRLLLNWADENKVAYEVLVWQKLNPMPSFKYTYCSDLEYIVYLCEDKKYLFFNDINDARKLFQSNIGGNSKETQHPTEKPLFILRQLMKNSSKEGDLVLDCFSGSGSTAKVCKELNRSFIGCEIDKEFYDMSLKRLSLGVEKPLL